MNVDLMLKSGALIGDKTPKQIFIEAKGLISERERWTQFTVARDECDIGVKPLDPRACKWCIMGAVACFCPYGIIPPRVLEYLDRLALDWIEDHNKKDPDYKNNASYFNDNTDHATVLLFLDAAVACCP